jgi:hypothetical protein
MRVLVLMLVLGVQVVAQQLPCDQVPEQQLPNCTFTNRSNFALHGTVRRVRGTKQELAPDPRINAQDPSANRPKLWVQEPGVWVVFSREGEIIESAGSLADDGSPVNPTRVRISTVGNTTTTDAVSKQSHVAREDKVDEEGRVVEQLGYDNGKLISHLVQKHDDSNSLVEDLVYDSTGKVISHSSARVDEKGRMTEAINIDNGRLIQHVRDTYGDNGELVSRGWYDEKGLFREITVKGQNAISWWQRPGCSRFCKDQYHGVGLNEAFHKAISYEFQQDGSLLTTTEYHEGRYGNIDNDIVELTRGNEPPIERVAYRYVRDSQGNWTERVTSIMDPVTRQMVDVRIDRRELKYY